MAKRYYWLKLKNDFFDSIRIKKLRSIAGGDTYTIIYLKLLLYAIDKDGIIEYEGIEKTISEELALVLDETAEDIGLCINYLSSVGLAEVRTDSIKLPEAISNVGSEMASAQRVRDYRARQKALQCNTDVTEVKRLCNVEKEIEKEKELEIEKDIEIDKSKNDVYTMDTTCIQPVYEVDTEVRLGKDRLGKVSNIEPLAREVVDYLNEKTGSNYHYSESTLKHIRARLNEKFTVEDCKTVIDKKTAEWKGTEWEKFLRPMTLFGSKFESYLNSKAIRSSGKRKDLLPNYYNSNPNRETDDTPASEEEIKAMRELLAKGKNHETY